jgi:exopolysaccharide biosynthesis polyprenyl glycosylphosphotransferase
VITPAESTVVALPEPVIERSTTYSVRSNSDATLRRMLVAADTAALALALICTAATVPSVGAHPLWAALTLPAWILIFRAYGLYGRDLRRIGHTTAAELPQMFHAMLLGCVLFAAYMRLVGLDGIAFSNLVVFAFVGGGAALSLRSMVRRAARPLLGPDRVLVVGDRGPMALLIRKLRAHPEYRAEPVAVVCGDWAGELGLLDVAADDLIDLPGVVERHRIDRLIISSEGIDGEALVRLLRDADRMSLKVSVLPQSYEAIGAAAEIDDVEGMTLLGVSPPRLSRSARITKRALDLVCSVTLLVVLAPLLAAIALAVKLESGGRVLFRQERIGRGGRRFAVLKFRTMVDGADGLIETLAHASRDTHWLLLDHDPRITPLGGLLRRTSLDELPQLWNVARGQMSLVGPRPLVPVEHAQVTDWGRRRLDVTPGLTGLWQVLGRSAIPFEEMVKLDYLYVANWSLWRDVELMLRTVPVLLTRRGAN